MNAPTKPTVEERQRLAIEAAQAGDWGPANELELEFLNDSRGEFVRWQILERHDYDSDELVAIALHRGGGSRGQLMVEWRLGEEPDWETVYTDVDGNEVEPAAAADHSSQAALVEADK